LRHVQLAAACGGERRIVDRAGMIAAALGRHGVAAAREREHAKS
jgi:hypothetical protein